MTELDGIRAGLRAVDQQVATGRWGRSRPWGGAGVIIVDTTPEAKPGGFYPDPRAVVTPYTRTLSWLFEQLWTVFRPEMDHRSKFEFFGRLANAAIRYQDKAGDGATERDLLGAVVHEAHEILTALEADDFEGPVITSGNAVFDDAVSDDHRPHYVTVEEADSWLTDEGNEPGRK